MSEPKILRAVTGLKYNETTINSKGTDYAVIGKWADGNPSKQDRKGLFVKLDNLTDGMTMSIAGPSDNIRGIITSTPAFCENAQASYFNTDGTLKPEYDYVGILGVVSARDDGTLKANEYCMPDTTGKAKKVSSNYGYQVIDRVDSTHVRVIVEPGADSSYSLFQSNPDCVVYYEAILSTSDWSVNGNGMTQTVSCSGMTSDMTGNFDAPKTEHNVDADIDKALQKGLKILCTAGYSITAGSDTITWYIPGSKVPSIDIPVYLRKATVR